LGQAEKYDGIIEVNYNWNSSTLDNWISYIWLKYDSWELKLKAWRSISQWNTSKE
jgi:hypothetical protein